MLLSEATLKIIKYWLIMSTVHFSDNYCTIQLLPTPVDPLEAEEMFNFADKDRDGK